MFFYIIEPKFADDCTRAHIIDSKSVKLLGNDIYRDDIYTSLGAIVRLLVQALFLLLRFFFFALIIIFLLMIVLELI